ncbi:MAG: SDR family oxidoreductase [Gammaproteobacteria bacterium]|nr:SDR family oxidoreductase [Gammaproteobacteria bacterium]
MDLQLRGKKAIVTGATRGIGLRVARLLADEGADVAICSRTEAAVQRTVAELRGRGSNAIGDVVDVAQGEALRAWIDAAAERLRGLDVFVSNVSSGPSIAGEAGWRACIESDILGAVSGCEAALPHLRQSQAGAIVFNASISGVMAKALRAPGIYAYGSCKAAVIAYAAQLSKDVARDGIRVNCVSPGPIYFEGGPWEQIRKHAPQMYDDALQECVLGRLGTPEEVAAAIVFLASPVSGFTTSQNLHVDGGYMQHIAF